MNNLRQVRAIPFVTRGTKRAMATVLASEQNTLCCYAIVGSMGTYVRSTRAR